MNIVEKTRHKMSIDECRKLYLKLRIKKEVLCTNFTSKKKKVQKEDRRFELSSVFLIFLW